MKYLNVSFYCFKDMGSPDELREKRVTLRQIARDKNLRGTILLSEEGFNAYFAGEETPVREYIQEFCQAWDVDPSKLKIKESWSETRPFTRMLMKIKKELIPVGDATIRPHIKTGKRLEPQELKKWYDEGREMVILDTRNDYEIRVGSFKNADHLDLRHSRNFIQTLRNLPEEKKKDWKSKPIVTFCTGGIRCEKASAAMMSEGFEEVYQLEGGILKYFEDCGGAHWNGDCFVFDHRVAVDGNLNESDVVQCFACRAPLSSEDQKSEKYVLGESCPYCEEMKDLKRRLNQKSETSVTPA